MKNLVLVIAGVAYVLSPLDIVPDVVPLVGWLDDLVIGILTLKNFLEMFSPTSTNNQISYNSSNQPSKQIQYNSNTQQNNQNNWGINR